jgi:hypothetical protein
VGRQDGTVGIGDSEAEFAGAILCPSQREGEQKQECGADRNAEQMDSPRPTGNAFGIFYSDDERRLWDGSATTFGRERRGCSSMSRPLECRPFGLTDSEMVMALETRPS